MSERNAPPSSGGPGAEEDDAALAETLARRTLELCRIPSVIGQEKDLADHVESWARHLFPAEEIFRIGHTLVLGRVPAVKNGDRPVVALFGHLDTVPPHPGDDAEARWEPDDDGGRVVGLGSSDMKSGLAVMQLLAERLAERLVERRVEGSAERPNRRTLPFDLLLVLYEREEGPYAENGLEPLFEALPEIGNVDFAICLEPSDNTIQMGCCGALHALLTFHGKSAHSARPWQGENAIHKAGSVLSELHARAPVEVELGGLRFREVMSATLAEGGRARNVVPERFTLNLNYRFAPGKSLEEAQEEVLRFVAGRATVEFTDLAPSGAVVADHPLFQRLLERTGVSVEGKQAWTDVGRLSSLGIPAVNFGPGSGAQAHQANEWVRVKSIVESYRHFERFLGP